MARQRLTSSTKIGEVNTPPFPGTVGNEDRPATPRDKYDNFTEQPGFETQQQGAPWKDDKRDEIGFGIPKAAAVFATAHKATRLAIMFLGDKVAPTVIEAQARDFMRLGSTRIDAALKRFADTEAAYTAAEESCSCDEDKKDDAKAEDKAEEKTAEAKKEEATMTKEQKESSVNTPVVTAIPAPAPVAAEEKKEEVKEEVKEEAEKVEAAVEDVELREAADDSALTIDMFSEPEVPAEMTMEDEQDVGSLFDIDQIGDATASVKPQPKKAGIKTLGGQPSIPQARVASEIDELAGLWKDAPDVSDVFGNE